MRRVTTQSRPTTDLESENKAARTIQSYMEAADQLIAFLREHKLPTLAGEIRATHVQRFLSYVIETHSASTAAKRYRSLRQLFRYLAELCGEDPEERASSRTPPWSRWRPPKVDKRVVPVMDSPTSSSWSSAPTAAGGSRTSGPIPPKTGFRSIS